MVVYVVVVYGVNDNDRVNEPLNVGSQKTDLIVVEIRDDYIKIELSDSKSTMTNAHNYRKIIVINISVTDVLLDV